MTAIDLRAMRAFADWTQVALARASGINRTKISQAECGEVELTADERRTIRRTLLREIRARVSQMKIVLAGEDEQKEGLL